MKAVIRAAIAILAAGGAATASGAAAAAQGSSPAVTTVIHFSLGHPRQPLGGTVVNVTGLAVTHAMPTIPRAWFFELTDGSKCRPLAGPGRVVEDERELYTCKYGSAGEADAVLGELDASTPVWTIHKVLINKKAEPQTVKSLSIASVRTVWQ